MNQPLVDAPKLAHHLKKIILKQKMSYAAVAKVARVDSSRISKICDGRFKRLSPVVQRICDVLKTKPEKFIVEESMPALDDLLTDINRLIRRSPARAKALQKILRIVTKVA